MIKRDLTKDVEHAEPLDQFEAIRAKVAVSPMVWHALLLPVARTGGTPKFVLTGHIVCHDCALCELAGDLRDGGYLVPWRETYGDCTDEGNEGADYFGAYKDDITGEPALTSWAAESLRACYYTDAGRLCASGYQLPDDRLHALDEYVLTLPEVSGSRMSSLYALVDPLFSVQPRVMVPDGLHLPQVEPSPENKSRPASVSNG